MIDKVKPQVVVVVGPTASGKSDFAAQLGRELGGEVISADSRQVYRGLDIGTGKITREEMLGVPHHLLDVADPSTVFTAHDYVRHAGPILEHCIARGVIPIICGGTGFYIDALLKRIALPDVPPNPSLRSRLSQLSAADLFRELKRRDPRRAETVDPHNPVRLIRAIEIADALGAVPEAISSNDAYQSVWFGMLPDESTYRARIHDRLVTRMAHGMVDEVRHLHAQGLSFERMDELGLEYRHLARFLQGKVDETTMLEELERDIAHYAKRQMTYWKRNHSIVWLRQDARDAHHIAKHIVEG